MAAPHKEPTNAQITERFRWAELKPTPQRLAIYRALLRTKEHPSPEQLHKSVRAAMPAISLATVYKTLDALADAGLIDQVTRTGDVKRYDGNVDPHHHLVCTRCHAITDIYLPELDRARPAPADFGKFTVTGMHIQVLGLCEDCSEGR